MLKQLLDEHGSNVALVIGNGINRFGAASQENSWNDLLLDLAKDRLPSRLREVPRGVSLTEFYDVLALKASDYSESSSLQAQFCQLMKSWKPFSHHRHIIQWAKDNDAPVLTTNFENVLGEAGGCELRRTVKGGFTAYYPWESYYGTSQVKNPAAEFGIWHINGMQRYRQSIRLGLCHYMGSVQRARDWLHRGNEKRFFSRKNSGDWKGASTWLNAIFRTPLIIFGLGLDENEVFMRWLLIERARYFRKFPRRAKKSWFIHESDFKHDGKKFFLDGVGVQTVRVESFEEIYGVGTWR